ncbi:Putative D-isomer specific 2-hydroxyacid dehydrogenase, catalytic domain-containing protein [Colletotrichum destructivum]|uniref:D-isomer specific 2-hydroxyacid dehydrogenase, catalytic domain-containing protein n=1 Tax=Colletotrichum destructivum TaxID=34406 RepID=A0AAX4IMD9_9PEZI|nr:Putative D-isomer specific 2-hydroxyacid dehydrogenase, catalytic domain-containing protein [Colletotrichum destructivum]
MKLAVFSAKAYDKKYISAAHEAKKEEFKKHNANLAGDTTDFGIIFHDFSLSSETVSLVKDVDAVCVFVNDSLTADVVESLHKAGCKAILLRCAGFNNVDLKTAEKLGIFVANVPSYSPEAVAEFAVALLQSLNRRTHRAYNRTREGNFNLDGLLGKTVYGKTVGIIGTGRIGVSMARIMKGFGCTLYAFDPFQSDAFKELGEYLPLEELLPKCDFISLHCPLMDKTKHIINEKTLKQMKPGSILVNTSRGGLVDTKAVIHALKTKHLGGLALDVYEGEGDLFYNDHSSHIIDDDLLTRLMTFPNVLICGHQGFFTEEALQEISECTFRNLEDFMLGRKCSNSLVKEESTMSHRESLPVRIV